MVCIKSMSAFDKLNDDIKNFPLQLFLHEKAKPDPLTREKYHRSLEKT
ncbi:hypothetical protein WES_01745 [Escherichia sp. KTE31]|nr:hypothetical protein WEW_00257 [Escherichia coli KTE33]EOU44498.1 hypothetical protein WC5_02974 [Escherichia sp. KTE114]EOU80713.1 hypothetical protein WES_01745 [Escherichia sp. KTE31]